MEALLLHVTFYLKAIFGRLLLEGQLLHSKFVLKDHTVPKMTPPTKIDIPLTMMMVRCLDSRLSMPPPELSL